MAWVVAMIGATLTQAGGQLSQFVLAYPRSFRRMASRDSPRKPGACQAAYLLWIKNRLNSFNCTSEISHSLRAHLDVSLKIYSLLGHHLRIPV